MRCDQCNKFVSMETETEPELSIDFSFNDKKNVIVEGTCRIENLCADCSTGLQEYEFQIEEELEIVHKDGCSVSEEDEPSYEEPTAERFDSYRPPKSRFKKHFYGVSIDLSASCPKCGAKTGDHTFSDEVQSSEMDSLV